jgi:hypothetical protein
MIYYLAVSHKIGKVNVVFFFSYGAVYAIDKVLVCINSIAITAYVNLLLFSIQRQMSSVELIFNNSKHNSQITMTMGYRLVDYLY